MEKNTQGLVLNNLNSCELEGQMSGTAPAGIGETEELTFRTFYLKDRDFFVAPDLQPLEGTIESPVDLVFTSEQLCESAFGATRRGQAWALLGWFMAPHSLATAKAA